MKILSRPIFSYFFVLLFAFFTADMAYGAGKDAKKPKPAPAGAAAKPSSVVAMLKEPAAAAPGSAKGGGGGASSSSTPVAARAPAVVAADSVIAPATFTGGGGGGASVVALPAGKNPVTTKVSLAKVTGASVAAAPVAAALATFTGGGGGGAPAVTKPAALAAPIAGTPPLIAGDTDDSDGDTVEAEDEDEAVSELRGSVAAFKEFGSPVGRKTTHAHAASAPAIIRSHSASDAGTSTAPLLAEAGGAGPRVADTPDRRPIPRASTEPLLRHPTEKTRGRSYLYDGLNFQINHSLLEIPPHLPYDHHLVLTSYDMNASNTARASITFFGAAGAAVHQPIKEVFVAKSTGQAGVISGETLFPDKGDDTRYKTFLDTWLTKLHPDLVESAVDPKRFYSTHATAYHHTEQWILWYLYSNLEKWITDLNPTFQLTGVNIDIYTSFNPCKTCGPTIALALPLLKDHVTTILNKLKGSFYAVAITSSVSSTHFYVDTSGRSKTHLVMPGLTKDNVDAHPSYQIAYANSTEIKSGIVKLSEAHDTCYHFWIPRLTGVTFSINAKGELKATLSNPGEPARPYTTTDLMNCLTGFFVHSHVPSRVRILDFNGRVMVPSAAVGVLKSTTGSVTPFNPISKVPEILSYFTSLSELDLRGALPFYADADADKHMTQPRQNLWVALRGLPLLTDLDLGAYDLPAAAGAGAAAAVSAGPISNNITYSELTFLLGIPAAVTAPAAGGAGVAAAAAAPAEVVPFPSIRTLRLSGNRIFANPTDAAANTAGAILTGFINAPGRAKPPTEIDLSNNGPYLPVSAAQAGRTLARAVTPTDIIF